MNNFFSITPKNDNIAVSLKLTNVKSAIKSYLLWIFRQLPWYCNSYRETKIVFVKQKYLSWTMIVFIFINYLSYILQYTLEIIEIAFLLD
jgi:hypothetical protein